MGGVGEKGTDETAHDVAGGKQIPEVQEQLPVPSEEPRFLNNNQTRRGRKK